MPYAGTLARRGSIAVVLSLLWLLLLGHAPAAAQGSDIALFGTLRVGTEVVEGVRITASADGADVGEATSDENGQWEIALPEPGTYTVAIDLASLPEGYTVEEEFAERDVEVTPERTRVAVLFPVRSGDEAVASGAFGRLLNLVVEGIKLGAIIAITSIGLSLIFGVTGLVNFAHGELVTFGAVVAYFLSSAGGIELPLIAAGLIAVVAGAGLGFTLDTGVFGPLRRRRTGSVALLVISIGLSIMFRHIIAIVYGVQTQPYADYAVQREVHWGPIGITPKDIWLTVLSFVVLAGVGLLLKGTRLGTAMRAVADNRDLAASSGINVRRIITAVWIMGGALAALGGVFQATTQSVAWDMGFKLLLLMFAAVILGGLGTAYGAVAGGLVVGIVTQVSTQWFDVEFKYVIAFLVLIGVLLFRPQGILGRKERLG